MLYDEIEAHFNVAKLKASFAVSFPLDGNF